MAVTLDGSESALTEIPVRVAILGSCVTAEAFLLDVRPLIEVSYHSRTSFISLNSPPLALQRDELCWQSNYARKHILADFNKTVLPAIYDSKPDVMVFDFVDERFDLFRSGESYITRSDGLVGSGFPGGLRHVFERIPRHSVEATDLWQEAAVKVTAEIRRRLPAIRFILHRAWWAEEFMDGSQVVPFSPNERRESAKMNEQLAGYYSYFESNVPDVLPVEVLGTRRALAQHHYGLAPYHYESAYYAELAAQIVKEASS